MPTPLIDRRVIVLRSVRIAAALSRQAPKAARELPPR